jgi:hypothetical protein
VTDYVDTNSTIDELVLRRAEIDIDNAVALFYQRRNRKFVYYEYDLDDVTLTTTTATSSQLNTANGYYDRTVLEIMSGADAGKRIFVKTHVNDTLTFWNTQTGLSGTETCRLIQIGKFPRLADSDIANNTYYKIIPEFIKEAVAYQYKFRLDNPSIFTNPNPVSGYRVEQDRYSEQFDTSSKNERTIQDRIDPVAWDILSQHGLTTQSLF